MNAVIARNGPPMVPATRRANHSFGATPGTYVIGNTWFQRCSTNDFRPRAPEGSNLDRIYDWEAVEAPFGRLREDQVCDEACEAHRALEGVSTGVLNFTLAATVPFVVLVLFIVLANTFDTLNSLQSFPAIGSAQ
jgi:hypothetical protein